MRATAAGAASRALAAGAASRALAAGAAAAALGALQTPAYVHLWAWPLPLLTLAAGVAVLDRVSPRRAAWLGGCYGTGWLAAGVWWLFVSMHRYGGLPAPLAALAVLALSAALSTYLALAAAAYARWRRGDAMDIALLASLVLLAELARGVLFTGFPWLALGYSQIEGPLAALAPWVGVYGIGAAGAAVAAALARGVAPVDCAASPAPGRPPSAASVPVRAAARRLPASAAAGRRWRAAAAALAVLLGLGMAGAPSFTRPHGTLDVTLLQTDVDQREKFSPAHLPHAMAWVRQALLAAPGSLVVAPETGVPLLPHQLASLAPGYWESLRAHFEAGGRAALLGVPLGDFEQGYTNSVVALGRGLGYRYDKWHLVPFGEFIPPGFRWFTDALSIPLGDFDRGVPDAPSLDFAGQRVAPNICYEDLFGEELARRFTEPARAPTLMANLSNIAWFGRTAALPQHLAISRLRALEFQLPMVRSTNTGATAAIDHRGRVTAQLPPHTRGTLTVAVEGRVGVTPFAAWAGHAGLWPPALLALAVVGAQAWGSERRARRRRTVPAARGEDEVAAGGDASTGVGGTGGGDDGQGRDRAPGPVDGAQSAADARREGSG